MKENNDPDSDSDKSEENSTSNSEKSKKNVYDIVTYPMGDICHTPNDQHVVARVDIYDGYTFRQFYELLKKTVVCAPMFFREDGINISRGNGKKSFIISAVASMPFITDIWISVKTTSG